MLIMDSAAQAGIPELWGGLECTIVRIRNKWRDQFVDTGHSSRVDDLDRVAALGIRTLRYPILWESVSPRSADEVQWSWHDERLERLRALGIDPIAGLLHHGSGPRYTNLLDETLPEQLAVHARRVAERYPWINQYTPVNEPVTTARFSALYGHWYPHKSDQKSFCRALINQCRAVALSMRAIREINPQARLVQTDDLGKTFSTPKLRYQADYENGRRWLTFDLLFGRVGRSHPWFEIFLKEGISENELFSFLENPCPPDIVGINHYLTSERYLSEDRQGFPRHHWGSNGRHRYADAEAVRIPSLSGLVGPYARLDEAWQRYHAPIAVTEVQHGCSRDEQLRWLMEVWQAARDLRENGADIRAVTVWAMFGATDWNTLLREHNGFYEPGAFDIRSPAPRPTIIAKATAALAGEGGFDHPVLDVPGWWRRNGRFYGRSHREDAQHPAGTRRILIIGARDELGQALSRVARHRGLEYHRITETECDLSSTRAIRNAIAHRRGWAVIDAREIETGEGAPDAELHGLQSGAIARACAEARVPFLAFSSHLVFDGTLGRPYVESDIPCPDGTEGTVAAELERRILKANPRSLIARTGPLFGPWDDHNFALTMLEVLADEPGAAFDDTAMVSPSYLPDVIHAALDLLIDGESGIWHLVNKNPMSELAVAQLLGECGGIAAPPLPQRNRAVRTVSLSSEKAQIVPSLESALRRFVADTKVRWTERPPAIGEAQEALASGRGQRPADALAAGP
jgi:dTDP-4-dehydrorhamnose reductase